MKHYSRYFAPMLIALASASGLASCKSETSKAVESLDDFLTVASSEEVHIVGTNMNEGEKKGDEIKAGASRKANMYANGDFSIAMEGQNFLGYTYTTNKGEKQYLLINTRTSRGKIYAEASALETTRDIVEAQLNSDYAKFASVYDEMKSQVGKTAQELGYDTFSMSYSVAPGGIAGYVTSAFKTTVEGNVTTTKEANRYLMLDQIDGKWCFTNYAERITETITTKEPGKMDLVRTIYTITDYQATVSDSYPVLSVALENYIVVPDHATPDRIEYEDGVPATKK